MRDMTAERTLMCNLYNISTTRQMMIEWTRAMRDVFGNLQPSLDIYPNFAAPMGRTIRRETEGRSTTAIRSTRRTS